MRHVSNCHVPISIGRYNKIIINKYLYRQKAYPYANANKKCYILQYTVIISTCQLSFGG